MALRNLLCTASHFLRSSVCFSSLTGDQVMINQTCPLLKKTPKHNRKTTTHRYTSMCGIQNTSQNHWQRKNDLDNFPEVPPLPSCRRGQQVITPKLNQNRYSSLTYIFPGRISPRSKSHTGIWQCPGSSQRALAQPHPTALPSEPELKELLSFPQTGKSLQSVPCSQTQIYK